MITFHKWKGGLFHLIQMHDISKRFADYEAIKVVDIEVNEGEIYGIIGASGAGKSTLLRLMNLLEVPDCGEVVVDGKNLMTMKPKQLREARKSMGMIFQHFNLVANLTIYDNVEVCLQLANYPKHRRRERVMECLRFVGLAHLEKQYPQSLSGGQKQRVAIARALANEPKVLLCDEPTSSLDPHTTAEILAVLEEINRTLGVTIVIVSHEMEVIQSICHRVSVMADGSVYKTIELEPKGIPDVDHTPEYFIEKLTGEVSGDA